MHVKNYSRVEHLQHTAAMFVEFSDHSKVHYRHGCGLLTKWIGLENGLESVALECRQYFAPSRLRLYVPQASIFGRHFNYCVYSAQ